MFAMIKLIVAKAANDVIGKDNDLIWRLPADLQFFSRTTKGNIVIMGRKNWESLPEKFRPLPDRINAVISRNTDFTADGCRIFSSLEEAIRHYENEPEKDVFIIGGGQIYHHALANDLVDEMIITHVEQDFEGDTWFPGIDESNWMKECILVHNKDDKNAHDFKIWKYSRKQKNKKVL